jgi:hypothetical protein
LFDAILVYLFFFGILSGGCRKSRSCCTNIRTGLAEKVRPTVVNHRVLLLLLFLEHHGVRMEKWLRRSQGWIGNFFVDVLLLNGASSVPRALN